MGQPAGGGIHAPRTGYFANHLGMACQQTTENLAMKKDDAEPYRDIDFSNAGRVRS